MRQSSKGVLHALLFSLLGILLLQPATSAQPEGNERPTDQIFLEIKSEKETIYLHESFPVTIKLYSRGLSLRDIEYPTLRHEGFVKDEFPPPVQGKEWVMGQLFDTVQFKATLSGTRTGPLRLGPATLRCMLLAGQEGKGSSRSFFGDSETDPLQLTSGEIRMEVLALPEKGRPAARRQNLVYTIGWSARLFFDEEMNRSCMA